MKIYIKFYKNVLNICLDNLILYKYLLFILSNFNKKLNKIKTKIL